MSSTGQQAKQTPTTPAVKQQHQTDGKQQDTSTSLCGDRREQQPTVNDSGVGPSPPPELNQQLERLTSSFKSELDYLKLQLAPASDQLDAATTGAESTSRSIGNQTSAPKLPKTNETNRSSPPKKTLKENHRGQVNQNPEDEEEDDGGAHEEQTRLIPRAFCSCLDYQTIPSQQVPCCCSTCKKCVHCACVCRPNQRPATSARSAELGPESRSPRIDNNNNNIEMAQTKGQTSKLIPAYFAAELIGTFMLVVIGDGVVGAYVLTRRPVDIFAACFAFGVGAMIATFASGKISGAHINPAASLAFALDGRLKWSLVPVYLAAQYLGGFLAALVLFVNYSEAIGALDGGERSAFGSANSTGGIFATYPANYVSIWGSLLDQVVGTAVLLFSISAVADKQNAGLEERHQPLIVAFVIGLICAAFSPNCGAIFNPARDLPPRLVTYLFGYGPAVWEPLSGTYWLLAGVVGPHLGAIIGVFAYKWLIGSALESKRRHEPPNEQMMATLNDTPDKQQHLSSFNRREQMAAVVSDYGAPGMR